MPSQEKSTVNDFKVSVGGFQEPEYRAALFEVTKQQGLEFIASMPGNDVPSIRSNIQEGSAYVGVIGFQYGPIPEDPSLNPEQLSLTEIEFNEALRLKRPVVLLVREGHKGSEANFETDLDKREKLDAFRARATRAVSKPSAGQFYVTFRSAEDFQKKARESLARLRDYLVERGKSDEYQQVNLSAATQTDDQSASSNQSTDAQFPSTPPGKLETKSLVFISASHLDYEWRDRLKVALKQFDDEIEWWDDSRIKTGSEGLAEINAAIKRASVAVVFLSDSYINSGTATEELDRLLSTASTGRLKLFPIMLHGVPWNRLSPEVRKLQIWAMDRPVAELRGAAVKKEMEKIAAGLVEVVRASQRSPKPPSPEFRVRSAPTFSESSKKILDRAKALAEQSHRAGVTSSCLLFALAQFAEEEETSRFVRNALERTGKFEKVYKTFLGDSGNPTRQSESEVPGLGKASKNVAALITNAQDIAFRVSRGSEEILPRHIFAALLVTPESEKTPVAKRRLKDLQIDLDALCREFFEFIETNNQSDDLAGWAAVLIAKVFQGGPAGYTSEFCGVGGSGPVSDDLGVKGWAEQLAELIALRETTLPLAIGLFGNWGSGKSHFMNLIDRALKDRMDEQKNGSDRKNGRWCSEIVPVYFNAWHYLDANLWASLVAQIFETLFAYLRPKEDEFMKVQELLEQASGATARAAEEVKVAEGATSKARTELDLAEANRRKQETMVDGMLNGLKQLLPNADEIQKKVVDLFGVEKNLKTVDDLNEVVEEVSSISGRAGAIWKKLWNQPGRIWRLSWLAGKVIGGFIIVYVIATYSPWLKDLLQPVVKQVVTLLGGISALLWSLKPVLAGIHRQVKQLEGWAIEAETAQMNARKTPEVQAATTTVNAAIKAEDAARARLVEAEARETQLKEEARSLAPERRLGRFIENRAQSLDYRGQLGLVSLARRDFQELSDIFANRDALNKKIAKVREAKQKEVDNEVKIIEAAKQNIARDSEAMTEGAKNETKQERQEALEETAKLKEDKLKEAENEVEQIVALSRSIDRIVLFVDDLDRCQPEKIVEVLQAVHLLLAFPLFAVVVGVDQRALRQSLRLQMSGLLANAPTSENGANGALKLSETGVTYERPATPLDYLEKIFHVPFHLPKMGKGGFETLIDRLTEPAEHSASTEMQTHNVEPPDDEETPPEVKEEPSSQTSVSQVPIEVKNDQPDKDAKFEAPGGVSVDEGVAKMPSPVTLVGSVPLQRWEREALRSYHPLIQTPRGATRLLNTYRLVRASVPQVEWSAFSGNGMTDGEFRVAMLLLAAAAGYPASARSWFDRIQSTAPSELFLETDASENDPAWNKFKEVYDASFAHMMTPPTQELFTKWILRVERFAF